VEDESDRQATKRAKEEEREMIEEEQGYRDGDAGGGGASSTVPGGAKTDEGENEDGEGGGVNPDDQDKMEDSQGNVLMTKAQFQELEAKLKPVDQYGIEFRSTYFVVYDPLKESRRKKELEKAQMIEEQTKDWELETLEHNKRLAEMEAEEDLIADKDTRLTEMDAESAYRSAQRCYKLERKLRRMTGRAWKLAYERGHGERKPFYENEDSNETTWERPLILDAEEERTRAWAKGWAALPMSALVRIAWFVAPSARAAGFSRVCTGWWRAVDGNTRFCTWIDPHSSSSSSLSSSSSSSQALSISPTRKAPGPSSLSIVGGGEESEFLTVGERVEARHLGQDYWYAATVVDCMADGSLSVLFTDGELERNVRREFVRRDRGARTTLLRYSKGAPLLETVNEHIGSRFGCGTRVPDPPRRPDIHGKDAAIGSVFVLCAGKHHHPPPSVDSEAWCRPRMRVVGEMFWAREKDAFETAIARLLPEDGGPRGGKRGPSQQSSLSKIDPSAIDVLDAVRASAIVSPVRVSGGEISGVAFHAQVAIVVAPGSAARFVECSFSNGVEIVSGSARFDACQFVGNSTGPALTVRAATTLASLTRCRIANNRAGIEFAVDFNNFDAVSIVGCDFKSNRQGSVLGPSTSALALGNSSSATLGRSVSASSTDVKQTSVDVEMGSADVDVVVRPEAEGSVEVKVESTAAATAATEADVTMDKSLPEVPASAPQEQTTSPRPPSRSATPTPFQIWKQSQLANLISTAKYSRPKFFPSKLTTRFRPVGVVGGGRASSAAPATGGSATKETKKRPAPSPSPPLTVGDGTDLEEEGAKAAAAAPASQQKKKVRKTPAKSPALQDVQVE